MAKLVDDDVVDDGQRGHEAFPVEVQITALGARSPTVAQILDLHRTCSHANPGCEVRHSLLNARQAFCLVKGFEHLMGVVTATLDDLAPEAEPAILQLERFVLPGHQLKSIATAQIEKCLAADPFARYPPGVEVAPLSQITVDPHPLAEYGFIHLLWRHSLGRPNGDNAVAFDHDVGGMA